MAKKRNTTKPQGTLTSEDVTQLYLALWALGDALLAGDTKTALDLHVKVFGTIPDTTTNDGARTRARNIRRKRNQLLAMLPTAEQEEMANLLSLWGDGQ